MAELGPGTILAERYLLREPLGEGAMGAVFLAEQVWLDRVVAVKVLRPDVAVSSRARRRLAREARAVARISHPNIVQVHDFGETEQGSPYLVMERVEGPTGRAWSQEAPDLDAVLRAGQAAFDGLAAAHAAGVLHRDIKPANMLIREGDPDRLVLLDFGIASVLDDAESGEEELTRPGTVMGTPLYMAPEQALGEAVGPPADVYSLGVVLYQWVYGKPPFSGGVREVMYAHVHRPLPEMEPRFVLPPGVDAFIRRTLHKNPRKRFADAATAARALRVLRSADIPPAAPHVPAPRIRTGGLPQEFPFVSREREAAAVSELLRGGGRTRLVIIRGTPGSGTTRLAREVVASAARSGAVRVGRAAVHPHDAPCAALLGSVAELDGHQTVYATRSDGSFAGPMSLEEDLERRARRAVQSTPGLLFLDDLHLAGEATIAFLERFARAQSLDPFPLHIVATAHVGTFTASRRLARRVEVVSIVDIGKLAAAEMEALLTAAYPLTEEAARRLAEPCGGSPMLAVQLLQNMVQSGLLAKGEEGWEVPDRALGKLGASGSLEELLRLRLSRLATDDGATGPLLEAAAVLGDRFEVVHLKAVLEASDMFPDLDALDRSLDRAAAAGLLIELPGAGDRMVWESGLLRRLVLADMQGSRRRRRLSGAAARALRDAGGNRRAVVELFLVAGEPTEAAPEAVLAGEAAVLAGEWTDAARLLSSALESGLTTRRLRVRALLARAEAENALGRRDDAEAAFEEALSHAAAPLPSARAWFGLGRSRFNRGALDEAADALDTALVLAEGIAGASAARLRSRILRTTASVRAASGEPLPKLDAPPPPADAAPDLHLEHHKTRGTLALLAGDLDTAVDALQRALQDARRADADADEPRIRHDLGVALRRLGRGEEARRVLQEGLDSAVRVRTRPLEAKLRNELGELARLDGRLSEAREHYAQAVAIWEAREDHQAFIGRLNLALADAEDGEAAAAREGLERLGADVPPRRMVPYLLTSAFVAVVEERHDVAEGELELALRALGNPPFVAEVTGVVERIVAAWTAAEELDRAGRARAALEPT